MQTRQHWDHLYASRPTSELSWFQAHDEVSLRLIRATGVPASEPLIDVGGGSSTLVDDLLAAGFSRVAVLDLSPEALAAAQRRLGASAARVQWIEADITQVALPRDAYAIWHDRAVFHFLTSYQERQAYVAAAKRALRPGGHLIIATFAEDGPERCSGLPAMRYSADALVAEFGAPFVLVHAEQSEHRTPAGTVQKFIYCDLRKEHD